MLRDKGVLVFTRSQKFDSQDLAGIDFEIWGKNRYACHFTIDVKSSLTGVLKFVKKEKVLSRDHHHPLLVQDGDSPKILAIKILRLIEKEI